MTNRSTISGCFLLLILLLSVMSIRAATPFSEYASRIEQAAQAVSDALETIEAQAEEDEETESQSEEIDRTLYGLREMIPPTEDIAFQSEIIQVDNSWLHTDDNPNDAATVRRIAARLNALNAHLKAAQTAARFDSEADQKLREILAQPEYQTDKARDSWIQRKLNELLKKLLEFLDKLFARNPSTPSGGGWVMMIFRVGLLVVIGLTLVYGTARLLKSLRLRRRDHEEPESATREILGEVIEENLSTEDLIGQATEMARRGEYRLAIRRTYIALLHELEQRGRLQLHRSKTNRDYLNALRGEVNIYPPLERMTQTYEQAWYGQRETNAEDYSGFAELYHEVVR
jgi:hypothetical protein